MEEQDNRTPSIWRILLYIFFITMILFKMANRCQRKQQNEIINAERASKQQQLLEQKQQNSEYEARQISNNIFYYSYAYVDQLPAYQKEKYGIVKVTKDSLINFDLQTKIKCPKDYYFQKNYDESLKMAFKSKEDLNIFIYDFTSPNTHIGDNFRATKKGKDLQNVKYDEPIGKLKTLSYNIGSRTNGFAIVFQNENYIMFFEFESGSLSPANLRQKGISFITNNLKAKTTKN